MAAEPNIHDRTVVERRDPLLGQVFDRRFRIDAKIAAGGFGAIYRVTRLRGGEQLALKVLHPNLTNDPGVVARFRREGAALTRLRDPNTIIAYELGEAEDGTLYILMELLRGESLYERFRVQGALPWRPVLALARAVCSSLSEAHALGIVHRDLKPTNIHLEPGDDDIEFVKVLDFGIAKILTGSDFDASELTHAGQMIGTLDYMSPEQMVGGQCGPSSDLYTLGIVMYEMIAGVKPFADANSATAALAALLTTTPARLAERTIVPLDVDRIVMRCLERQAELRFQTADELAAAIDDVLARDEQITSIAPRIAAAAAAHGRTGIAMPRTLTPIQRTVVAPASRGLPAPQLDSTLVGHEPVARLPAGPPRIAAASASFDSFDSAMSLESSQDSATQLRMRLETTQDDVLAAVTAASLASLDAAAREAAEPTTLGGERTDEAIPPIGDELSPPIELVRKLAPRATPHAGVPIARAVPTNLREAYPTIHHPPPSPTRPAVTSAFDDRPQPGIRSPLADAPLDDRPQAAPRPAARLAWIALGAALVLALAAAWLWVLA